MFQCGECEGKWCVFVCVRGGLMHVFVFTFQPFAGQ